MSELGQKVKQLRETLGMTQADLARSTGLTQATISRIEKGLQTALRYETIMRLADKLGVTLDYLRAQEEPTVEDALRGDSAIRELVRIYMKLSNHNRAEARSYLRYLYHKQKDPDAELRWVFDEDE